MKITGKLLTSAALLTAAGWMAAPAAMAGPLSCGSSNLCVAVGSTGNVVATSTNGSATAIGTYTGGWAFTISATGNGLVVAPDVLDSNTAASQDSSGSLTVYVTETGLTGPLSADLLSSLASNTLPPGWTITGQTFYDSSNSAFGEGTALSSLSSLGTDLAALSATGMYSITEVYTISAPSSGNGTGSLSVAAVPEPATLALFGAGLLGCALFVARRRRASQPRTRK